MDPKTENEGVRASAREEELLRRLRERPEMMAALEELMAVVQMESVTTSLDAMEENVVERTRELARAALQTWAQQAEEQTAREQRAHSPRRRLRTKKNCSG